MWKDALRATNAAKCQIEGCRNGFYQIFNIHIFVWSQVHLNSRQIIWATMLIFCAWNHTNLSAPHTVIWLVLIVRVFQEEPDRAPEGIVTLTEQFLNYFLGSIKLTWFKKKKIKGWFNLKLMGADELICNIMKLILWVNLKRKLIFSCAVPGEIPCWVCCKNLR